MDAYINSCKGHSTDTVLCDPDLTDQFVNACRKNSLRGNASIWNRLLLRIRKQGKLPKVERIRRRLTLEEMDNYSYASEIAMQLLALASVVLVLCEWVIPVF